MHVKFLGLILVYHRGREGKLKRTPFHFLALQRKPFHLNLLVIGYKNWSRVWKATKRAWIYGKVKLHATRPNMKYVSILKWYLYLKRNIYNMQFWNWNLFSQLFNKIEFSQQFFFLKRFYSKGKPSPLIFWSIRRNIVLVEEIVSLIFQKGVAFPCPILPTWGTLTFLRKLLMQNIMKTT